MKLGPSDPPCREVWARNYINPVQYRGEPVLRHEWFYRKAGEASPRWHQCEPAVCRECQRNADTCTRRPPMA